MATYPPLTAHEHTQVAVLGAGITGALVAYELSSAGVEVVVLDQRDVAMGSTAASTCLLQYEIDQPLRRLVHRIGEAAAVKAYRLSLESLRRIGKLDRALGGGHGYRRRGSLQGASRLDHVAGLRQETDLRRRHGFDVEFWSRAQLARCSTLPYPAALVSAEAAEIDAHRFTHSLLAASVRQGARVYDRTRVTRRQAGPGHRILSLQTDRGFTVKARHLVIATGYETEPYLPEKLTQLHSTYALVTEPVKEFTGWPGQRLLWETARPYLYLRQTDDRRVLVGGYDEPFRDPRRRDALLPQKQGSLLRRLHQLFPDTPTELGFSWCGTFAETPDGLPYIGEHPRQPRVYFALGYGGNGITFSVLAAGILRDLICEGHSPDAELFRFDRPGS